MATVNDILNTARVELGVTELPAGSNKVKYNTEYYGREVSGSAYPWCCAFVWWVFKHAGASDLFYAGNKTAYCPTVESFYKQQGRWHSEPQVGDLALFDFSRKGIAGHIGIVEQVNSDGTVTTIEGNTGAGNDANGGAVMRRTRRRSTIRGFARPAYNSTSAAPAATIKAQGGVCSVDLRVLKKGAKGSDVRALQILLKGNGYDPNGIDGSFGPGCQAAVKKYQADRKLQVDGQVGPATWGALLK